MYNFDNPELPTLQPWRLTTPPPATRFVFERNEYFHRVDSTGQQLPYIDRVVLEVVDNKLIPVKTGAGETDLQSRGLFFKHYTFLKESEERSKLVTHLWATATRRPSGASTPTSTPRTRSGASCSATSASAARCRMAVDRDEINQVMYLRPRHRRQQHGPAAEPALRARVSRQLGRLRPRRGQRAARRDRPRPSAPRTACACCPTAGRWR